MTNAQVVAHSINIFGDELISVLGTFPRIILAEMNTHRMLGKNTSSSRAIPTPKLIKMIMETPFIPIAWQKEHPGMQGTEYYDIDEKFNLQELKDIMFPRLLKIFNRDDADDLEMINMFEKVMDEFDVYSSYTLNEFWLMIRDKVVNAVILLYCLGTTKQIANRLLEPFMWTTMLITGPRYHGGWDNFFKLRCPIYQGKNKTWQSWTDMLAEAADDYDLDQDEFDRLVNADELTILRNNRGAAEIHMMAFAECVYEAIKDSTPKLLKPGEWHIPFQDKIIIDGDELLWNTDLAEVKIATAMAARTSYTVVGDEKEINYRDLVKLHDEKLLNQDPPHSSPFEHCAYAMGSDEYNKSIKGRGIPDYGLGISSSNPVLVFNQEEMGWCRNYKGFIQYRHIIENEKNAN